MISRQAIHAAAKREDRGLQKVGRKPWNCPDCTGSKRRTLTSGVRVCSTCHPGAGRGRPRKPTVDSPPVSD